MLWSSLARLFQETNSNSYRQSRWLSQQQVALGNDNAITANPDAAIGMEGGSDHRWALHGLALHEASLVAGSDASTALQIVGQRGIGRTGSRLLGHAIERPEVAHMGRVAVIGQGKGMYPNHIELLAQG